MTTKTQTHKPNQYAGTCATCGEHVPAGEGTLGGKVNGRWTVRHTDCTAPTGYVTDNSPRSYNRAYRATYRRHDDGSYLDD